MTATAWPPRQYDDGITAATSAWMDGLTLPCSRDPELFFSEEPGDTAAAKRICRAKCGLARRAACLKFAGEYGVWGGLAREQRIKKHCPRCRNDKPLRGFSRNGSTPDGYDWYCKPCASAVAARRRARNSAPRRVPIEAMSSANAARSRQADQKAGEFARLTAKHGRDEAIKLLKITKRTAERYAARLREQQEANAA